MPKTVAIRETTKEDESSFIALARASIALHKPWVSAPTTAKAFRRYLAHFDSKNNFTFVVYLRASGKLVGAIHITEAVYGSFRSAYLGYYAFTGAERQGLMTKGLKLAVRHAFNKLKLHRLEANIQPNNTASIALVRACGFTREGYSRAYLKIGGRWQDHERWAIVRE